MDQLAAHMVLHHATVWCPTPETAQATLSHLLLWWSESPLDTMCALLIPRVFQQRWSSISKHLVYHPLPSESTSLGIPLVLVLLPAHTRVLDPPRLDSSPRPFIAKWHQEQAEIMRGLS
jgi:hypothetical protein